MKAARVSETFEAILRSNNAGPLWFAECYVTKEGFKAKDKVRITVTRLQPAGKRGKR